MIAALVKRLNRSIKAIAWAKKENMIPWSRTMEDDPSNLAVASLESLFAPETFDRVELSPINLPRFAEFWSSVAIVIDLAVVSYCGAHLVTAPEHYSALSRHAAPQISIGAGSLRYSEGSLACMSRLLCGKRVWVLEEIPGESKPVEGVYLSTTIADLADLWAPYVSGRETHKPQIKRPRNAIIPLVRVL